MSESAKDLYFRRGEVILGPESSSIGNGYYKVTMNGTRINSVVEAGKSYIITFNSDDPEWANMTLLRQPGSIRTPLQQLNSTTYIVKFTATGEETGIGINNLDSGKRLYFTNYTLYEYIPVISGNVLRPFVADEMYYRNQEVQKLYLGSRLVWESQQSEPVVSEPTFMLRGGHNRKQQNLSYIKVSKQDFTNYGVDPSAVNAITVNDRKYNVTSFLNFSIAIYFYIENADTLELDGSETLTFHYRE